MGTAATATTTIVGTTATTGAKFSGKITLVETGEGIAIIPSFVLPASRDRKVVLSRLINPVVNSDFCRISLRGKKLPPGADDFTYFLRAYIARWAGSAAFCRRNKFWRTLVVSAAFGQCSIGRANAPVIRYLLGGLSANLTLLDYGRIARHPGRIQENVAASDPFKESPTYRSVANESSIGLNPWCTNSFSVEKLVIQSFGFR
jgi:hypothetical protein